MITLIRRDHQMKRRGSAIVAIVTRESRRGEWIDVISSITAITRFAKPRSSNLMRMPWFCIGQGQACRRSKASFCLMSDRLEFLFSMPMSKAEVVGRLRNDPTISEAVRRQALGQHRNRPDYPQVVVVVGAVHQLVEVNPDLAAVLGSFFRESRCHNRRRDCPPPRRLRRRRPPVAGHGPAPSPPLACRP
jgi:hypothetical protein